jgi:hypothetical protein
MLNSMDNQMRTLREQYGSEVKFTQYLSTKQGSIHLNKVNQLIGLPNIVTTKTVNEMSIEGGSIDVVGFTERGEAIVYEHQDISGSADQTHASKTPWYCVMLRTMGYRVLGGVLLCENVSQKFLDAYKEYRWSSERRSYMGHFNVHIVKTQFTDEGEFVPALFEDSEVKPSRSTNIKHYENFVAIYAQKWDIQREDYKKANKNAITLWHRISELDNNYMAYIHTLSNTIKIGLHFEPKRTVTEDEKNFLKAVSPTEWEFRDSAKMKATIELTLPLDSDPETWWKHTESLKQNIRKHLLNS